MTVREALLSGEAMLRTSGAAEPKLDAELLLRHSLGWDRAQVLTRGDAALTDEQWQSFRSLLEQRATGMPVQYVIGSQEFYGLEFRVTPAVLIPRPETELLVDAALGRVSVTDTDSIADVGTGSGAIAVAISANRPAARLIATDVSAEALVVARENAQQHGVLERIEFREADLLPAALSGLDLIVSNPPYVAEADRDTLTREVREFEPHGALFAGDDGLAVYRRLVPAASRALKSGGWLLLEIGAGQAEAVGALLSGWSDVDVLPDLRGIPRVVTARNG